MSQQHVHILTRWATCADHISYGPRVYASFDRARQEVARHEGDDRNWFERSPGRALRWLDQSSHDAGFWEIQTCPVE